MAGRARPAGLGLRDARVEDHHPGAVASGDHLAFALHHGVELGGSGEHGRGDVDRHQVARLKVEFGLVQLDERGADGLRVLQLLVRWTAPTLTGGGGWNPGEPLTAVLTPYLDGYAARQGAAYREDGRAAVHGAGIPRRVRPRGLTPDPTLPNSRTTERKHHP
ncbi:hypothetical protein ACFV4P_11915 [Kitasatospora sp. NPDC059795]|uniref:hypothetical protein n=1 Tax=Kitasatospora sp. NPDC059795 TaxID=3346949 RepID=UPI00365AF8AD